MAFLEIFFWLQFLLRVGGSQYKCVVGLNGGIVVLLLKKAPQSVGMDRADPWRKKKDFICTVKLWKVPKAKKKSRNLLCIGFLLDFNTTPLEHLVIPTFPFGIPAGQQKMVFLKNVFLGG